MSEVRLVVREENQDWSGTVHGSVADRAIAALSDDPTTLDELERAVGRFQHLKPGSKFFAFFSRGLHDEPHDAGLVIIDLAARLVVCDSTYSAPLMTGGEFYHDGEHQTEIQIPFHLAEDWLLSSDGETWKFLADQRREGRAARPPRDFRAVLYGPLLYEFLVREVFAAYPRREAIAAARKAKWQQQHIEWLARERGVSPEQIDPSQIDEEAARPTYSSEEAREASIYRDAIKEIHAAWLMTPRQDLGGSTPREALLAGHHHVSMDMDFRCHAWSVTGRAPPTLPTSSRAYRFAPFGTHEQVLYYDLIRELLWSSWDRLTELAATSPLLDVGDFLTEEVPRLAAFHEAWLDSADPELHGRTPRSIIENERIRLPEAMSHREAIIDDDCPLCQMAADMHGPGFWHLDGCNQEDEFPFQLRFESREEWEADQREYAEFNRRFAAKEKEREALGVDHSQNQEGSIWKRSYSVDSSADVPLGFRLFDIGAHLAEVIYGLRGGADRDATPADAQTHVDRLNRDFGNLRDVLQSADVSLAASLIEPVIERFAESLDVAARSRSDLEEQCEELTAELRRLLDPPPPPSEWSGEYRDPFGPDDDEDMDIPF